MTSTSTPIWMELYPAAVIGVEEDLFAGASLNTVQSAKCDRGITG